jgi:probable rRNA maturation factor
MPNQPNKPPNKLSLSVQYPDPRLQAELPRAAIRRWVRSALFAPAELTIRFVDAAEGQALNRDYRGKDYATNVLTFAYTEDQDSEITQADIVLCTDVLQREAKEQHKTVRQHAVHLILHGVLHAQGYDHESDDEAAEMEQIEIELLAALRIPNPYTENNGPGSL